VRRGGGEGRGWRGGRHDGDRRASLGGEGEID
jgi:hypothetical protein